MLSSRQPMHHQICLHWHYNSRPFDNVVRLPSSQSGFDIRSHYKYVLLQKLTLPFEVRLFDDTLQLISTSKVNQSERSSRRKTVLFIRDQWPILLVFNNILVICCE